MRASYGLLLVAATALGCSPDIRRLATLEVAVQAPLIFVEGATSGTGECPFPAKLAEFDHAGNGRMRSFSFSGFSVSMDGVARRDPQVLFPSAPTDTNTELQSMEGFAHWSLRLSPPGEMLVDGDCPSGIVTGASLPAHSDFVVPFGDDDYCVLGFAEFAEVLDVCHGDRVGPHEDWLRALERVSGLQI